MEAVKQQILGLAGWSDKEKGKAIFKLSDSNVRNLANLPDSVLKGALEELLAESSSVSQPLSQEAKQEQLQANFRQCFSQQQQLLLWERSASLRSGPIAPDQDGLIEKIGSRFRLEGMERPCTQLLLSLQQMNLKFIRPGRVPKWRQTLQLFRLVAAPGQGKSTALQVLWWQLGTLLQRNPKLEALCDHNLKLRITNSVAADRVLVFTMDLSYERLAQLTEDEQRTPFGAERSMASVLAWRMLRACLLLPSGDVRESSYEVFVRSLPAALRDALTPLDVLRFIVSAAGLARTDPCMVVFAYDEANSVTAPQAPTWFQKLLHEFVNLREAAAQEEAAGRLAAMPVVVTASTRASASSLAGTQSGKSKVKDLQLARLSDEDMQRIVEDFAKRMLSDEVRCPEHVASLIEWLGGNPRLLAQLLCALSGRNADGMRDEEMHVGNPANAQWLKQPHTIKPIIQALVTCVSEQWRPWLGGNKASLLVKAFAHAVLGKPVEREGEVVAGQEVTWSQLESDNVLQLSQHGLPGSSRSSSPDSPMSTGSIVEEDLREDAYGTEQPDAQPDQYVSLAPLLAITAQQQLEVELDRLVPVPLLQYLADDWRSREETDVGILVLKLCLLRLVMGQEEASLSELYRELENTDHGSLRIRVPEKGFRVKRIEEQMTQEGFQQLLSRADASSWAFIGPGNKGIDSWLTLKDKDNKWLILQLQSKVRTRGEAVDAASVAKEAEKGWEVPPEEGDTLMLFVTDQHAARGALGPIPTKRAVVTVTLEKHESFYGIAKFIKDALQKWRK